MPEKAHEEEEKAKRSWRTKTRKTPGNPPIGSEEKAQDLKLVAELALGDAGRDRMAGQWGSSLRKSAIGDVEEIELAKGEFLQTDERGGGALEGLGKVDGIYLYVLFEYVRKWRRKVKVGIGKRIGELYIDSENRAGELYLFARARG